MTDLHHPFIVPHIASWVHHGHTVNIVYGYCEQGDLASLMAKQRVRDHSCRGGVDSSQVALRHALVHALSTFGLTLVRKQAVLLGRPLTPLQTDVT